MNENDKVKKEKPTLYEKEKINAIISLQYSPEILSFFEKNNIYVVKSPKTGRIKYVYLENKLIGTIRATDERFVPTIYGAKILREKMKKSRLTIQVTSDAAEWIAKGRTVFCKHVIALDEEIRPREEVFIIDEDNRLIALGKSVLSGREIKEKKKGKAVKIRKRARGH